MSPYLNLGNLPPPNVLKQSKSEISKTYPLVVLFCTKCSLSQLSVVVNPNVMYKDYVYNSSISKTFQEHCSTLAKSVIALGITDNVLDIASNDGCLLEQFRLNGFKNLVGVEPAKNFTYTDKELINDFWSKELSYTINQKFDVITATNVFAHVDDLNNFVSGASNVINDTGVFIIEVPYLMDLIDNNQFDTIYHEHLSYFLIKPIKLILEKFGLGVFRVERTKIHGGSIRVYSSKNRITESSVSNLLNFEETHSFYNLHKYQYFSYAVNNLRKDIFDKIESLRSSGMKIMAYGASAKGSILLNYCGITNQHIISVVDDTPSKQGKFIPGCGIPIVPFDSFKSEQPDYILLTAWNFAKEMMDKTKFHQDANGKYIIPIPQVIIA